MLLYVDLSPHIKEYTNNKQKKKTLELYFHVLSFLTVATIHTREVPKTHK